MDDITSTLKESYIIRAKQNVLYILGASSILGNPIQFVNSIGTGVKEFFYQPYEGFVDGPLEGAKGIGKGVGSLVKHTTEGIFGSVASIVQSASKGILVLTDD